LEVRLKVIPTTASDYNSLFKKAVQLRKEGYTGVYVLIDLDVCTASNAAYQKYLKAKKKSLKDEGIRIYETMPCLEFWFLLHLQPFSAKIYKSYGEVVKDLKKHWKDYEKTKKYFTRHSIQKKLSTLGDTELASTSAKRLRKLKMTSNNISHPFSEIDLFLEAILAPDDTDH